MPPRRGLASAKAFMNNSARTDVTEGCRGHHTNMRLQAPAPPPLRKHRPQPPPEAAPAWQDVLEPHRERRSTVLRSSFSLPSGTAQPRRSGAGKPVHGLVMETMQMQSDLGDGQLQLHARMSDACTPGHHPDGAGRFAPAARAARAQRDGPVALAVPQWPHQRQSCSDDFRNERGAMAWAEPRRQSISGTLHNSSMEALYPPPVTAVPAATQSREVYHGVCSGLHVV